MKTELNSSSSASTQGESLWVVVTALLSFGIVVALTALT